MGLTCSHNAWDGGYISFHTWRIKIAATAGLPPLELMEGFYDKHSLYFGPLYNHYEDKLTILQQQFPIRWEILKPSPLHDLLRVADDGEIVSDRCIAIAEELEKLIDFLPDTPGPGHIHNWRDVTAKFVAGLKAAARAKEPLLFR